MVCIPSRLLLSLVLTRHNTRLLQGNDETELPEQLLATIRVAHLNLEAAVEPPPETYVDIDDNDFSATV